MFQFVNDASGGNLEVGRGLYSCTKDVAKSPVFELNGRRVVLIDTPGFDDNEVSDVGTLKRIAAFMSETCVYSFHWSWKCPNWNFSYGVGQRLTGIVYLHRIVDNRMGGATARTFNLFRRMCGTDTLRNVVIATNMWSNPPTSTEEGRERQLRQEFFRPALDEGARMVRRGNPGREATHDVLRMLLGQTPRPARLQQEIVDERRILSETDVGRELEVQLTERVERQQREITDARREIQEALQQRDQQAAEELASYEKEREAEIDELRQHIEILRVGMEEERRRYRERLREEQLMFDHDQQEQRTRLRDKVKGFFGFKQKRVRA